MDNKDEINGKDDLSEILKMKRRRRSDNDGAPKRIKKAEKEKENPYGFGSSRIEDTKSDNDDSDLHDVEFAETADENTAEKTSENKALYEAERQLKKQNQRRKSVLQVVLGAVIAAAVIFIGVNIGSSLLSAILDYTGINTTEFEVVVEIPEDPTLDQVADVLKSSGIITDAKFFSMYVEMKKNEYDFVGGQFTLSSAMNYGTIVSTLLASEEEQLTVEVTIIEGMTAVEIGELLEENAVCRAEDFVQCYREKMDVYDFERRVLQSSLKFNQLEGYLFPDKYEFYVVNKLKEDPDAEIDTTKAAETAAKKIYSNFNSKITKTMYKQMNEMGLTLDELITLASMVQAEVGNVEDMRMVASVFLNRLHNSETFPQLQSDVTVFYVRDYIEPYYKDYDLSVSFQTISDAYDTYVAEGVPAGAVCNPGLDAINAVLDPAETDYFYFCSNEETGETFYARTVEEHEANLAFINSGE